jgi:propionyl-CoA synthetase
VSAAAVLGAPQAPASLASALRRQSQCLGRAKVVPCKPRLDVAIALACHWPAKVLMIDRGLSPFERVAGRNADYAALHAQFTGAQVPCVWLDSNVPSDMLYTSGTTGRPKGVQRDTGGNAAVLAASMKHTDMGKAGETCFSTSDIGWLVGHRYVIYGPLIAGMATLLYAGLPTRASAGNWWRLVDKHPVSVMFSAPTAVAQKTGPGLPDRVRPVQPESLFPGQ